MPLTKSRDLARPLLFYSSWRRRRNGESFANLLWLCKNLRRLVKIRNFTIYVVCVVRRKRREGKKFFRISLRRRWTTSEIELSICIAACHYLLPLLGHNNTLYLPISFSQWLLQKNVVQKYAKMGMKMFLYLNNGRKDMEAGKQFLL